jgi:hypothetical protein
MHNKRKYLVKLEVFDAQGETHTRVVEWVTNDFDKLMEEYRRTRHVSHFDILESSPVSSNSLLLG